MVMSRNLIAQPTHGAAVRSRPTSRPGRSLVPLACAALLAGAEPPCPIQLHDMTKESGVTFVHTDGSSGQRYIVETVCCGLATFDYDNDGDIDIYFLNGARLKGSNVTGPPPTNELWRNDGAWKFTNVTKESGLGDTGHALGVAGGDYDNDGDQDVYINNFGSEANALYRNNGDGTFTNATKGAGVADGYHVGAGANFLDADKDGDLDLYVAHYVDFTYENHRTARFNGYPAYVGPMDYRPTSSSFFRNNGDGTFTDASVASGIAAHKGTGMGTVCADFDNDGDTDLFVGNDVASNFLFVNDGAGKFEEAGLRTGVGYDFSGNAQATMGVDCGDYDNDGFLDFYMTSYQQETATLFRNGGDGTYEDVTMPTGAGQGTLTPVTWGTGMVDFDNDGHRDIFVACGHLHDNVELFDNVATYFARNIVLRNDGDGTFTNVSDRCGDGLLVKLSSRGAAFDDLDNDGDVDAVILNSRREPTLLRNDSQTGNRWLQVRVRGVKTNRDGVGARVTVVAGDLTLVDEVHSGRGYQSHYGSRLYFGLGKHERIDRVEVRWIGGGVDIFEDVRVDRQLTITEGAGSSPSR